MFQLGHQLSLAAHTQLCIEGLKLGPYRGQGDPPAGGYVGYADAAGQGKGDVSFGGGEVVPGTDYASALDRKSVV